MTAPLGRLVLAWRSSGPASTSRAKARSVAVRAIGPSTGKSPLGISPSVMGGAYPRPGIRP